MKVDQGQFEDQPCPRDELVQGNHMEDRRTHSHAPLPGPLNLPRMTEEEVVVQVLAYAGSVAEEDVVEVGTSAYIACRCTAMMQLIGRCQSGEWLIICRYVQT
jgi:hypothetical protein